MNPAPHIYRCTRTEHIQSNITEELYSTEVLQRVTLQGKHDHYFPYFSRKIRWFRKIESK